MGLEMEVEVEVETDPNTSPDEATASGEPKACADCHTTKTPLWRGGPEGPKVRSALPWIHHQSLCSFASCC